jgi:hypothetical protein
MITVTTIAERNAITSVPSLCQEGMIVYVKKTQCYYALGPDLTTWVFHNASAALARQPNWVVLATGSDDNDGKAAATALLTVEELNRRLCPFSRKCIFPQDVTIVIGAGRFGKLDLNYDFPVDTPLFAIGLSIIGNTTQSVVMLSDVVNTTPLASGGVRGQLTTLSGAFVAKRRIQAPPNALAVFAGKIAYSTGLVAGNPLSTYCTHFMDLLTGHVTNVAKDTQVSVDVLNTTLECLILRQGPSLGYGYVQDCIVEDLHVQSPWKNHGDLNGYTLQFYGCEFPSGNWENPRADFFGCKIAGPVTINSGSLRFYGTVNQGLLTLQNRCTLDERSSNSVDGGRFLLMSGSTLSNANDVEFCNGSSSATAIDVHVGSLYQCAGQLWGASTNYGKGINIESCTQCEASYASLVAVPADQQLVVAGQNKNYSDIPFSLPRARCGFGINPDIGAAPS